MSYKANIIAASSFEDWPGKTNSPWGFEQMVNGTNYGWAERDTGEKDGFGGEYSAKVHSLGAGAEGIKINLNKLKPSTTYSVSIRVKATNEQTAKIWTTGGSTDLSLSTNSTSWVTLTGTFVTDGTPTDIVLKFGADNAGDILWIDELFVYDTTTNFDYGFSLNESSDGWIPVFETWTYSSYDATTNTTTLNVSGRLEGKYMAGMKIRLEVSGYAQYYIITRVTSTITLWGGNVNSLSSNPSNIFYSTHKAPFGFPVDPAVWTIEVIDTSNRTQATPTQNTWYNIGGSIVLPIGIWEVSYQCIISNGTANKAVAVTLSNANNTQLTQNYTAGYNDNEQASAYFYINRSLGSINLSAKTTYYLNLRSVSASSGTLIIFNSGTASIIRAVCAYL